MYIRQRSDQIVQSPIGKRKLDNAGSAIGAARMKANEAYGAIPMLLKEYIDNGSESAWTEIRLRIDNVYHTLNYALEALDAEASFSEAILNILKYGKKLCFKPNLVELPLIDPRTHGPVLTGTSTPWEFMAPVMRWFHDERGVSYHQMVVGEAGTATPRTAAMISMLLEGTNVTTQAVLEGKYGTNYGGWGFYFTRKYLAECHDPSHSDDPIRGYEDSLSGVCLPPGEVHDRLLIYDLNKISDDLSNGREVPVADGINYHTITLHKVIVGGNPNDPEDMRKWPGCVLVNVCKLKVHTRELFTCAIKNLGIGLYPMEANTSQEPGKLRWEYAIPNLQIPMVKMGVPHAKWIAKIDEETLTPIRNSDGSYSFSKTGGLEASIADSIQAVKGQGVMMLHVVDAIEVANICHIGPECTPIPEGLVFAGTDMVAIDACMSRYLFSMVPMAEIEKIQKEYSVISDIIQKVPMPKLKGKNIVTGEGYDSPHSRFSTIKHCEDRGLGEQRYYIVGNDLVHGGILASIEQHLGRVNNGIFVELLTKTLYHAVNKPLWDLQATCLAYLDLNDKLTGSDFKRKILKTYDENNDGIIDYRETGKGELFPIMGYEMSLMIQNLNLFEALKLRFLLLTTKLKYLKKEWNQEGHNLGEELMMVQALVTAFGMSNIPKEANDPFFPGMIWGKGKWPSMQFALNQHISKQIYGRWFPKMFDMMSPFGNAFRYADAKWNGGKYNKALETIGGQDIIGDYHKAIARGDSLLPFVFYTPRGFGTIGNARIPNVDETDNPERIFTAAFNNKECWRELRLSDFHLK